MPVRIRLLGRYGNGIAAVLFGLIFVFALTRGELGFALFCLLVSGLAGCNVYITEKAVALTAEEEWLKAELRKAELRRKLGGLAGETPETVVRNHGL
jgi:hypothetical protein